MDLWIPAEIEGATGLVNSSTGEAIDLTSVEWEQLALVRRAIVNLRPILNEAAALVDREVARRLDMNNERHILLPGVELRVNAPHETLWDVDKLQENLSQLVNEGRLAAGVPPKVLKREVTYKPQARELTQLLTSADPRIVELVGECREVVDAKRKVQVVTK